MESIAPERICGKGILHIPGSGLHTEVQFQVDLWVTEYGFVACPYRTSEQSKAPDPLPEPHPHLQYSGRATTHEPSDSLGKPTSLLGCDAIIEFEPGTVLPRGLGQQIGIVVVNVQDNGGKLVIEFAEGR